MAARVLGPEILLEVMVCVLLVVWARVCESGCTALRLRPLSLALKVGRIAKCLVGFVRVGVDGAARAGAPGRLVVVGLGGVPGLWCLAG